MSQFAIAMRPEGISRNMPIEFPVFPILRSYVPKNIPSNTLNRGKVFWLTRVTENRPLAGDMESFGAAPEIKLLKIAEIART